MVRFKMAMVEVTVNKPELSDTTEFLSTTLLVICWINCEVLLLLENSDLLLQLTGGRGKPVTVQTNTAKVDWLRTRSLVGENIVTLG